MEGSAGNPDFTVHDLCDFLRIYYRNHCQQMAESRHLGLQQRTVSATWPDLPALYGAVWSSMYNRNLSGRLSAACALRGRKAENPHLVTKTKFYFCCPENGDIM